MGLTWKSSFLRGLVVRVSVSVSVSVRQLLLILPFRDYLTPTLSWGLGGRGGGCGLLKGHLTLDTRDGFTAHFIGRT